MISALETAYAGCRFRSRIEARHAVLMDRLRVRWEYEKDGYVVDGRAYLPDFWLPDLATFLEIKGRKPTGNELQDCAGLAQLTGHRVVLAYGDIPWDLDDYGVPRDRFDWMPMWEGPDVLGNRHTWCYCPRCGCAGIEFHGLAEFIRCPHHVDGTCLDAPLKGPIYTGRDELTTAAYEAARSARFEHGQSGAPIDMPQQRSRPRRDDESRVITSREPKRLGDILADVARGLTRRATDSVIKSSDDGDDA